MEELPQAVSNTAFVRISAVRSFSLFLLLVCLAGSAPPFLSRLSANDMAPGELAAALRQRRNAQAWMRVHYVTASVRLDSGKREPFDGSDAEYLCSGTAYRQDVVQVQYSASGATSGTLSAAYDGALRYKSLSSRPSLFLVSGKKTGPPVQLPHSFVGEDQLLWLLDLSAENPKEPAVTISEAGDLITVHNGEESEDHRDWVVDRGRSYHVVSADIVTSGERRQTWVVQLFSQLPDGSYYPMKILRTARTGSVPPAEYEELLEVTSLEARPVISDNVVFTVHRKPTDEIFNEDLNLRFRQGDVMALGNAIAGASPSVVPIRVSDSSTSRTRVSASQSHQETGEARGKDAPTRNEGEGRATRVAGVQPKESTSPTASQLRILVVVCVAVLFAVGVLWWRRVHR